MKTIIIGCGATMEKGFGGTAKFSGDNWYPHALHTHTHCTTVDINPTCSPSIVLNFTTPNRAELVRKIGNEKFDLIVLEALPNYLFYTPDDCIDIIANCNYILTATGKVFIPLLHDVNDEMLKIIFYRFGYKLIHESTDYSLIYPIVSAVAGKYVDEYLMRYKNQLLRFTDISIPTHYFLFKR